MSGLLTELGAEHTGALDEFVAHTRSTPGRCCRPGGLDHQGQICTKGDAAVCTLRQLSCSVCALQEAGRMCGAAPNLEEMFMTCLFIRNWLTCPKKGDAPNIAIVLQASRLAHSSLSLSVRHTLMSVECCHCKSQSLSSCTPDGGRGER